MDSNLISKYSMRGCRSQVIFFYALMRPLDLSTVVKEGDESSYEWFQYLSELLHKTWKWAESCRKADDSAFLVRSLMTNISDLPANSGHVQEKGQRSADSDTWSRSSPAPSFLIPPQKACRRSSGRARRRLVYVPKPTSRARQESPTSTQVLKRRIPFHWDISHYYC